MTRRTALVRFALITLVVSASVGAIVSAGRRAQFPISAAISAAYCCAIGIPAMVVFPRISERHRDQARLRLWLGYLGILIMLTVAATFAIRGTLALAGVITADQMWAGMLASLEISMAVGIPCTVGAATYARLQSRIGDARVAEQRATTLATEARIASLESRIRPHFLFNALNSAIALIPEDPDRAEQVLERLAALLRFSLDAHAGLVPLHEEMRVVTDYLEIERARFGDRLQYRLDVPDELAGVEIPAFAIQTLVENSVKYAVSARKHGATIVVTARVGDGRLAIDVTDDGPGFSGAVWIAGHGLDSLRVRLGALYGERARVLAPARPDAQGAAVTIEVPAGGAR